MRVRKADTDAISAAGARAQLKMLLSGARSLDQFTAEGLARTHRVPVKLCAQLLADELAYRGRMI
ncbi:hypothetical protein [Rhizorhapis sp.]|uniref:hypothetical protein n=1 Tax=Rhizorhapis sp. TaxID=1968842 RepID=UPI002B45F206|nr:hypothetical protein [Rhizorhapis sp.]HKR17640.1 hypothetical protein [Rhizorhapis sp.]